MDKLNEQIKKYHDELQKGYLQDAYRGIMEFIAGIRTHLSEVYPEMTIGALYQGFMDMTFFTITPETLKRQRLKVALVYLHESNSFEVWLSGANRQVQADFLKLLKGRDIPGCELSEAAPGVDSIVVRKIPEDPDFSNLKSLRNRLEVETIKLISDMEKLLMGAVE